MASLHSVCKDNSDIYDTFMLHTGSVKVLAKMGISYMSERN